MRQMCLDEVRDSGFWVFNKKTITFDKTELVDECNIQIIQQLPDKISFPKNADDVIVNDKGIKTTSSFYSWADICATGIKKEAIPMEYADNYKTFILIGLTNGNVFEVEIKNNTDHLKQIGHLIELYKYKFKKQADT